VLTETTIDGQIVDDMNGCILQSGADVLEFINKLSLILPPQRAFYEHTNQVSKITITIESLGRKKDEQ